MSKHTPGPWGYVFTDYGIVVDANAGKTDIAAVTHRVDDSVEIANAKLLASAPELLEALKEAESFIAALPKPSVKKDFSSLNRLEQSLKVVRAAIAKATGEQS